MTGYADTRVLIASHIKPWYRATNEERVNPMNGLILTPNLDKVFDLGLITFDPAEKGAHRVFAVSHGTCGIGTHGRHAVGAMRGRDGEVSAVSPKKCFSRTVVRNVISV